MFRFYHFFIGAPRRTRLLKLIPACKLFVDPEEFLVFLHDADESPALLTTAPMFLGNTRFGFMVLPSLPSNTLHTR